MGPCDGFRFSPAGESLSFASPKESNQRKGDPTSLPCGSRVGARGRALHQLALARGTKRPVLRSSDTVRSLPARARQIAALKGDNPRCRSRVMPPLRQALADARRPLVCRREAQPPEGKRGWVSELRSRHVLCALPGRVPAPPRVASIAGEPKADTPGVAFSLVTFFWPRKRK